MDLTFLLVLIMGLVMLIGVIGLVVNRVLTRKGIGQRVIQFATVVILTPSVIILAALKLIDSAATQVLLGGVAGYVLSSMSRGRDVPTE